jgi:hypothetical protein
MMALMRRSVQGTQPLNGGRSRQLRGKTRQSQDTLSAITATGLSGAPFYAARSARPQPSGASLTDAR